MYFMQKNNPSSQKKLGWVEAVTLLFIIQFYFTSGKTRTSCVIEAVHNGHSGSFSKLNDSRIQPLQSSLEHTHIVVSTSGTGSLGPLEKDMTASPFSVVLLLYSFLVHKERDLRFRYKLSITQNVQSL